MRKQTFMVGRTTGGNTVVVFVSVTNSPIVGPWTVRAVISSN